VIEFIWYGIDENGMQQKGVLSANSVEQIRSTLLERRIALLTCRQRQSSFFVRWINYLRMALGNKQKIHPSERIYLFRCLSLLLSSGVSVVEALSVLSSRKHLSGHTRSVINNLCRDVKRGVMFSIAMENVPSVFTSLMIHLVRAGEEAGEVSAVLSHLSLYLEDQESLKKQVRSAALLPIMTLTFAVVMLIGIGVFIIPRFEELFESTQIELSPLSGFVFGMSGYMRSWYVFVIIGVIVGLVAFIRYFASRKKIKKYWDGILMRLPLAGTIYSLIDLVCFTQSLSMLLDSGLPMPVSLRYASAATQSSFFKQSTTNLYDMILQGVSLEAGLESLDAFPQELSSMVAIGERSGNVPLMLGKACDLFKDELQRRLSLFTTILQPVLMVAVGGIIALVLVAIYMPIISLAGVMPTS
jgi:type IV pilus assembly protein PilC